MMKKTTIIKYMLLSIFAILLTIIIISIKSNSDKRNKIKYIPKIQLINSYSETVDISSNKDNKQSLFIYFNPGCEMCDHITEQIIINQDILKDINVNWVSFDSISSLIEFRDKNNLDEFENLQILYDHKIEFYNTFNINNIPSFYLYDKSGLLINNKSGSMPFDDIIKLFQINEN